VGQRLLLSVAGFGACTLVFAFSRDFALSFAMLFIAGALDNIRVVVRHTLVSLRTPEALRGRVSSVNQLFIGSSNELGEFESGLAAQALGPVAAVAWGGALVIGLVLASIWVFPDLARMDRLSESDA
jgi:MFS family permease